MTPPLRTIRAARGSILTCKGWPQEAALRMLMNNLDPEVAERPDELVVYGGTGKAARSWDAFDAIVTSLRALEGDETLVVQSGKPVAVFRTHPVGTARHHRQCPARPRLGDVGSLPCARGPGPHDVRADDRGIVDLHRDAGNPAGHVRDTGRPGTRTVPGRPAASARGHGRSRGDGWRAATRGDDEQRRGPGGGSGSHTHRPPPRHPLCRRGDRRPRRRHRACSSVAARGRRAIARVARQCRRRAARPGGPR